MLKRFDDFQVYDTYSKKIGLVGENHDMPDLYGDQDSELILTISPNQFSTYQVFNRLAGSGLVPNSTTGKFAARKLKTPITAVSPNSQIKTYPTFRHLNSTPIPKDSLYFTRPTFENQIQIATHNGQIFGARQIIDGKPVYLDLTRLPNSEALTSLTETLHSTLGSEFMRFRVGVTGEKPIVLAMENFKLNRPDLVNIYFKIHESYLGKLPAWYKHKIQKNLVKSYLNEYINREEVLKKCPYIL
jgi:hypothetical protein